MKDGLVLIINLLVGDLSRVKIRNVELYVDICKIYGDMATKLYITNTVFGNDTSI